MKKLNVAILYDAAEEQPDPEAKSRQRPEAFRQAEQALAKRGHAVELIPASANIRALVAQLEKSPSDIIFNLCEGLDGRYNQEQDVAALLKLLNKRYTGSDPTTLALAQDKELSKKLLAFSGIRYPKYAVMDAGKVEWSDELEFPVFIKPLNLDASIGIDNNAIVRNIKDLMERISYIHTEFGVPALIEEFIDGREIYVGVLGNAKLTALPVLEWDFSKAAEGAPKIASSEAKWNAKSELFKNTVEVFPEDIPEQVSIEIQATAMGAYRALKLSDYGRIDMRIRQNPKNSTWEHYIIEVNPNPHLDSKGELPMAARRYGLNYPDLLERIMALAFERYGFSAE
jgi:D-alanine-D-alanine ligase